MTTNADTWSAWTRSIEPIMKGKSGTLQVGWVDGVLTSARPDMQGERLNQDGGDFTPLMGNGGPNDKKGPVHVEHPVGIFNAVGEPMDLVKIEILGPRLDGKKGTQAYPAHRLTTRFMLDAAEYGDNGRELAMIANKSWDRILAIHKSSHGRMGSGYSAEGGCLQRDPDDKKHLMQWWCASAAITNAPRNRDAWFEPVYKSMLADPRTRDVLIEKAEAGGFGELLGQDLAPETSDANGVDLIEAMRSLEMKSLDIMVAKLIKTSMPTTWRAALKKILGAIAASK